MISGYRLMWLMVMFDLPVVTKQHKTAYRHFVDFLEDDGFVRLQYSVFVRPTATLESTDSHAHRVMQAVPVEGEVRILRFTDRQWARMDVFRSAKKEDPECYPEQLVFFDEELNPMVGQDIFTESFDQRDSQVREAVSTDRSAAMEPRVRPANPALGIGRKKRKSKRKVNENIPLSLFDEP
jgi:CRISPR-associated protein Cas2